MTFEMLTLLVQKAITLPPPGEILTRCEGYYVPYYNLIYLIACELDRGEKRPVFVELGVEKGRGVGAFALGSPRAKIVGYDTTRRAEIESLCRRFPNIDFREEPSLPPKFKELPVDVLHVDTEHSYANAREEFNQWKPYLASPAIVLFDDLHAMEDGVKQFFDEQPYPKIQDDRLHPSCGYGVLLYETS